jgi:P27 family predicted phage terminase small subunit
MPPKPKAKPETAPPLDPLPPPPDLPPDAAVIWRKTVAHLARIGTVNTADEIALETFCFAVLRQRRIAAEIQAAPIVADGKISPLLKVAEAVAASVKNLGHVLGLNPTARVRLPMAPRKGGADKWADL